MVAAGFTGMGCDGALSEAASVISGVAVDGGGGGGGCTGALGVVDVGGGCTGSLEVVDVGGGCTGSLEVADVGGGCAVGMEVVDAGACAVGVEVADVLGSKGWGCMSAIGGGNAKGWEDFLLDLAAFCSLSFLASTTSGGLPSLTQSLAFFSRLVTMLHRSSINFGRSLLAIALQLHRPHASLQTFQDNLVVWSRTSLRAGKAYRILVAMLVLGRISIRSILCLWMISPSCDAVMEMELLSFFCTSNGEVFSTRWLRKDLLPSRTLLLGKEAAMVSLLEELLVPGLGALTWYQIAWARIAFLGFHCQLCDGSFVL